MAQHKIQPLLTIDNLDNTSLTDTITLSSLGSGYSSPDYGAIPPFTTTTTTSGTSFTYNQTPSVTIGTGLTGGANAVWTTSGTGYNWQSAVGSVKPSATISLKGEEADIDLNGKSLRTWMEKVEERLNILTPNTELEKEWDDLRKLGEKYRKLEKKCKEKSDAWNKLKKL